jgi:predicted ABC-type ATPase
MARTGTPETSLVVLRGNSGSGKSTVARVLRARRGGCVAWVEQDYLRRVVLHEHDIPDGLNIGLISQTVRYALDHHCDVILEGILYAPRYSEMLRALSDDHLGQTLWYWVNVSFDETLRRHATRPQASDFGGDDMRRWYRERNPLEFVPETSVPQERTIAQTVQRILADMLRGSQGVVSPRAHEGYIDGL